MTRPWTILHGDVREVTAKLEPKSFDAALGDPPYGLKFMGQRWDYRVPSAILWANVLRVLKPGAFGMFFGGSRTFHRLMVAIEDGGFEVRDLLLWLYIEGWPKSLDIAKAFDKDAGHWRGRANGVLSKSPSLAGPHYNRTNKGDAISDEAVAWDGYGTCLKPAFEPIALVRRMPEGSIIENARRYGVGGLDIEQSKVGDEERINPPASLSRSMFKGLAGERSRKKIGPGTVRRYPANVVIDEGAAAYLELLHDGISRCFYSPKADRAERDAGLDGEDFEAHSNFGVGMLRDGARGQSTDVKNTHETVKPIELVRYFARMMLPPARSTPRRILVPFSGSGSEMIACLQAGWDEVVGIEREAKHIKVAEGRITNGGVMHALVKERRKPRKRVA